MSSSPSVKFTVGLDYGTTFSSVAFNRSDEPDIVHIICRFPQDDRPGDEDRGVPSVLCYARNAGPYARAKEKSGRRATRSAIRSESDEREKPTLYGWEVDPSLFQVDPSYSSSDCFEKMKLRLCSDIYTAKNQQNKLGKSAQLQAQSFDNSRHLHQDYITKLLLHTKCVLEDSYGLTEQSHIELAVTVPTCFEIMSTHCLSVCVQNAMRKARFGSDGTEPGNVFIVNEAEAAATSLLRDNYTRFEPGMTALIMDAGGGTLDSSIYTIAHSDPLRLDKEVGLPVGIMAGASELNDQMRNFATKMLHDETYLMDLNSGITIASIVEKDVIPKFEIHYKRTFGSIASQPKSFRFPIDRLRESKSNTRLQLNTLVIGAADMGDIFNPLLKKIGDVMKTQLRKARATGTPVDCVILAGGFANSPALQAHLRNIAKSEVVALQHPLRNTGATAVSIGAVRRALDKSNGPRRFPLISIGITKHLPCSDSTLPLGDKRSYPPGVFEQTAQKSSAPGEDGWYIMDTIEWWLKMEQGELAREHKYYRTLTFMGDAKDGRWIATLDMYWSEHCVEDYYKVDHPKNKNRVHRFEDIEIDLTDFRGDALAVRQKKRGRGKQRGRVIGHSINVRVELTITDLILKVMVRYPAEAKGHIIHKRDFSIASAFQPGTF